ncbi:kinesin-like protein KIF26B [Lates japonicus]|uniref:Kinesin-like protein KIF26B n=1 Tax=Lates japonicus TaxID=270547 RepID=A0AAD3NDD7_LATJO|nr:kinesin-like protein KIF26B [Lates japonicus]
MARWVPGPLKPPSNLTDKKPLRSKRVVYVSVNTPGQPAANQAGQSQVPVSEEELEQTKRYLMLEPHKWTTESLETVADKLETRVNFCKAHLMMITCLTCPQGQPVGRGGKEGRRRVDTHS